MDDFFVYAARGTKSLYRRKPFVADTYYHVFNRRGDRADVLPDDADKQIFVDAMIRLRTMQSAVAIAFAVLDNHYHLVIRQTSADAMTAYMRSLMTSTAMRVNRRHGTSGPLFDDRYQARMITTPRHLKRVIAYVHANPRYPHTSPWSSHRAYLHPNRSSDAADAVDANAGLSAFRSAAEYLDVFNRELAAREQRQSANTPR